MLSVALLIGAVALSTDGYAESNFTTKSSSKPSKGASTEVDAKYQQLPTHFGKLNLKEEQREEVYQVRKDFSPKLEELEKQLEKMRAEMMKKMESALTTTQRRELTKLRGGALSASKSSSSSRKTDSAKSGSAKKSGTTKSSGSKSSSSKRQSTKKSSSDDNR